MTRLTIVGGVYRERCIWPSWNQVYGSAGRAAQAAVGHVKDIALRTYKSTNADLYGSFAKLDGIDFVAEEPGPNIGFQYVHSLSSPIISPSPAIITQCKPLTVKDRAVLRFGMLEGQACVDAEVCVYDPQSAFNAANFADNGSKAKRVAIVGNRKEIVAMVGGGDDYEAAARTLLRDSVEVVVVKAGVGGAAVIQRSGTKIVPAFLTEHVFTVGSGDVFASLFATQWACNGVDPVEAAKFASRGVADYVQSMSLPVAAKPSPLPEAIAKPGRVYLAGPFFNIAQRWLIDEARRCLQELGLIVFSPIHDGGGGDAEKVAPADLFALEKCDLVFALLDGMDSGTLFEVGWARAKEKPVYALAQSVSTEDLKMINGSGCRVFDDFVTALHQAAWRV